MKKQMRGTSKVGRPLVGQPGVRRAKTVKRSAIRSVEDAALAESIAKLLRARPGEHPVFWEKQGDDGPELVVTFEPHPRRTSFVQVKDPALAERIERILRAEQIALFVERSRKASGVPERLEDPAAAEEIARILMSVDVERVTTSTRRDVAIRARIVRGEDAS